MIEQKSPQEMTQEMLEKSREIILNFLAAGFTNLDPKYYVFQRDRRNTEAET